VEQATEEKLDENRLDRFGAVASSLCAVHCAICAVLPAAFGALGLSVLLSHQAEWAFTLIAIAFAGGALVVGWRVHRSRTVAVLLSLGIVGLLASRFIEMGSDHHGHHEGDHHATAESGEAHSEETGHHDDAEGKEHKETEGGEHDKSEGKEHDDAHHDEHGEEEGLMHMAGAGVGVLAGLLLLFGHITNIRSTKKCRESCCP
jgi:hypothetical protein